MPTGYPKPFRTLSVGGATKSFDTQEEAKDYAVRRAAGSGQWVGVEKFYNDHTVRDGINNGWWLIDVAYPPGETAPPPPSMDGGVSEACQRGLRDKTPGPHCVFRDCSCPCHENHN